MSATNRGAKRNSNWGGHRHGVPGGKKYVKRGNWGGAMTCGDCGEKGHRRGTRKCKAPLGLPE